MHYKLYRKTYIWLFIFTQILLCAVIVVLFWKRQLLCIQEFTEWGDCLFFLVGDVDSPALPLFAQHI